MRRFLWLGLGTILATYGFGLVAGGEAFAAYRLRDGLLAALIGALDLWPAKRSLGAVSPSGWGASVAVVGADLDGDRLCVWRCGCARPDLRRHARVGGLVGGQPVDRGRAGAWGGVTLAGASGNLSRAHLSLACRRCGPLGALCPGRGSRCRRCPGRWAAGPADLPFDLAGRAGAGRGPARVAFDNLAAHLYRRRMCAGAATGRRYLGSRDRRCSHLVSSATGRALASQWLGECCGAALGERDSGLSDLARGRIGQRAPIRGDRPRW